VGNAEVSPKVDEIAYDPTLQRVYCASGWGIISVVGLDHNRRAALPPLTSSSGAHSIAVDPRSHMVWIVFAKNDKPYVQAFTENSEKSKEADERAHHGQIATRPNLVLRK
jgi:hypothetical protein